MRLLPEDDVDGWMSAIPEEDAVSFDEKVDTDDLLRLFAKKPELGIIDIWDNFC